jgi:hypothetical protein
LRLNSYVRSGSVPVEWEIEDDLGRTYKLHIPNTIYSATNRNRLLSPQHWAQSANDTYPIRYGTWCATYDDRIVLQWDQRRYSRTAYLLDEGSNVGIIRGVKNKNGDIHYANLERAYESEVVAMSTVLETVRHTIDDYEDEHDEKDLTEPLEEIQDPDDQPAQIQATNEKNEMISINDIHLDDLTNKLDLSEEDYHATKSDDPRQEYLRWHCKLGHLSHVRMQQLIANGTLPKSLNIKTPPICVACLHGKVTKRPWRTKAASVTYKWATSPGEVVAVDQLESSTAGFIGQMRGAILTNLRY